ncbi:MAG: LysM peptidoglycan-binding domain-containing protein [Leadbetterella sp.]
MEFEDRNTVPDDSNKSIPVVVLFVLIGIICMLLYAGWYMMSDSVPETQELSSQNTLPNSEVKVMTDSSEQASLKQDEPLEAPKEEEKTEEVSKEEEPKKEIEEAKKEDEPKEEPKSSGETTTIVVKEGQTFLGIANKYNISYSTLKNANKGVNIEDIVVGKTKVKVPIQTVHTVGPGDILKVVAKKYDITVEALMAANGKTKNYAERGEKLIIPMSK